MPAKLFGSDGRLTPPRPTTSRASRVQRGPSPANAESGSFDRRRTPRRAQAGHLLPRAPKPNVDARYCSEHGTPSGMLGHAEDSHRVSSRPPRFSESCETALTAPIAAVSGTGFGHGCMALG